MRYLHLFRRSIFTHFDSNKLIYILYKRIQKQTNSRVVSLQYISDLICFFTSGTVKCKYFLTYRIDIENILITKIFEMIR